MFKHASPYIRISWFITLDRYLCNSEAKNVRSGHITQSENVFGNRKPMSLGVYGQLIQHKWTWSASLVPRDAVKVKSRSPSTVSIFRSVFRSVCTT